MRNQVNIRIALLLAAALLATPVLAQEALTLDDAVGRALSANRDVVAAGYDKEAAKYGVVEAAGNYAPKASIQEIYMRSNNPVMAFGTKLNQGEFAFDTFDFPVGQLMQQQPLPDSVAINFPTDSFNEPDVVEDYMTRLEVEQPIFAGGKIITGIYQATKMNQAAKLTLDHTKKSIQYKVAEAYYNTLRAQKFVELTQQVIQTVERHVKTAKDYYEAGMALESDYLQALVYLDNAKVAVVEAANNRRLGMAMLNYLMGEPQTREWTLDEPVGFECAAPDVEQLIDSARAGRSDLAAMTRKVDVAVSQQAMAATGFVPTLGLKADYDFHDDNLFGSMAEDWTVYVVAKWDVLTGLTDIARTGRAVQESKAAKTRLASMREGIALEVRQRYLTLQAEGEKLATANSAVDHAQRNLEIVGNRYGQGLVKVSELLDAQTDDTKAKTNRLNAAYDLILARLALKNAVGDPDCEFPVESE